MKLNEMFDEFNELYSVGKLDFTHDEVRNITQLIQDEVDESFLEAFDTDYLTESGFKPKESPSLEGYALELTDILYITLERMTALGLDAEKLLKAKHASNMSKVLDHNNPSLVLKEVEVAKRRYPSVDAELCPAGYVLRCKDTNKVVKPTTYTPAIVTEDMLCRK